MSTKKIAIFGILGFSFLTFIALTTIKFADSAEITDGNASNLSLALENSPTLVRERPSASISKMENPKVITQTTNIEKKELELPWIPGENHGYELQLVSSFLPENPVILEAGAHYGEDTVVIMKKWPTAKIYAFEPNPKAFSILKNSTEAFPNIKLFPFGLFSKTGEYTFNINSLTDGSSSLLDDNHVPGVTWYRDEPIKVFCMNLDEWAESEGIDHIDYMWLDMEGAEFHVLSNANKILKTVRAISTEANFREFRKGMSQFSDVRTLLERNGFKLYQMWEFKVGKELLYLFEQIY